MPTPEKPRDPLGEVTAAAARLTRLEESRRAAAEDLAKVMYDAHKLGHTWSEIAARAGLASPHTARARARDALDPSELSPSVRWRQERGRAPRPKTDPLGMSVSEAARQLGVTRKTVYAWIDKGRLQTVTDEAGRPRVLLDD